MSKRVLFVGACLAVIAAVALYALRSRPAPSSYGASPTAEAAMATRARFELLLEKHVTFHFEKTPLDGALKQISDKVGVPIVISIQVSKVASIASDEPVTLDVSGVTLRTALNLLLNPLDLTWTPKDEALEVTMPELAGGDMIAMVYPVRDLVTERSVRETVFDYQELIHIITAVVAPTTWDEVGGPGSIQADPAAGALVIGQSAECHAQVELLLSALRKSRDLQGIRPGETITRSANSPPGQQAVGGGANRAPVPARPQRGATRPASGATPPPGGADPSITTPE